MKKLLFCVIFATLSLDVFSQSISMDSLRVALKNAKHDTTHCKILSILIENEYDEAIWPIYNLQLLNLAKKNIASTSSQPQRKKFQIYYANAINNKGFLAQEHGDVAGALDFYYQALKELEPHKENRLMATTISNIAYIYMHQGDFDKSLSSINKALELQKIIKDSSGIAFSFNNLGTLYNSKKDIDKSLYYFQKSLRIQEKLNDINGIAVCLSNIADVYINKGDRLKAIDYIFQAIALREKINDNAGISYNYCGLANVFYDLGKLNEALDYGTKSYKVANEIKYVENIRNASKALYKIYKKQNNTAEALKMHELYILMRDSINSEDTKKSSIRKQFQYDYEKKAAADSVKVFEEKKVTTAQLKQEKTQRFALYGGIVLVGLFGAFMFNRFKVTKKQNHLIQNQKTELQKQKELVEEHQKETIDSIHYAKRIQNALMANSNLINENIEKNFILFKPKDIVSGDFYWATQYNNHLYLAVCDSTGHGVPGAFMSLLNMGFLSEAIREKNILKPHEILNFVRERLINTISTDGQQDGMDGILICYNKQTHVIEYAAANNEPVLIRNNEILLLPKDKMPVGKGEKTNSFALHTIQLQKGDSLYLYTDGFADQFGGPKGKKFKYKPLNELLLNSTELDLEIQKTKLETTFNSWKGNLEQVDDVLLIGIKI